MTTFVVTAQQAANRDAAAIAAGTPSIDLMRRAGIGAARTLRARFSNLAPAGVLVFTGPGNNGGDGWVVAGTLASAGVPVRVVECMEPRTPDAISSRDAALPFLLASPHFETPAIVVDALLGTGATGALKGAVASAAEEINALRDQGAKVVALDLPTGLDASTGEFAAGGVVADLTISFATVKRGHLVARDVCGDLVVVDIGLGEHNALADGAPALADDDMLRSHVAAFSADAHKGTRKKLLIVGGSHGMAGAVILAARAALRAGIGMVRVCVAPESIAPIQSAVVEATAIAWPALDDAPAFSSHAAWADALLIGPGLGPHAREMVEHWLRATRVPVVLDADALNAFAGDVASLGTLLHDRLAVITPHAAEFARLTATTVDDVLANRWRAGAEVAEQLGAAVLLKGVPTIVSAPDRTSIVSAAGNPLLATAGSGDLLGGIVATLLAQTNDPLHAAACAAWVHGRAAELARDGRAIRGLTLDDVLKTLSRVWETRIALPSELLAFLPFPGSRDG